MRTPTKRRARQLALVTRAAPVAAWALEQGTHRAEARDKTSPTSRRLRQGADFVQRVGRGPLADRLRQRPVTTVTWRQQPPQPDQHHGQPTAAAAAPGPCLRCCHAPRARPRNLAHPRLRRTWTILALVTGFWDGRTVGQHR
jgi:hypothetical protein